MKQTVWDSTRELHHSCESHPVGGAFAGGVPPVIWYACWLNVLKAIHEVLDPKLPQCLHRVDKLKVDIKATDLPAPIIQAAEAYAKTLDNPLSISGAAYVLTGAHLMGGEIMRRKLLGYSTTHLEWEDRKLALTELTKLRDTPDITEAAKACFKALLDSMDEIQALYPQIN